MIYIAFFGKILTTTAYHSLHSFSHANFEFRSQDGAVCGGILAWLYNALCVRIVSGA